MSRRRNRYQTRLTDGGSALLTLVPTIQERANEVLGMAKAPMGAIVVMKTDGTILAMAGLDNRPTKATNAPSGTNFHLPLAVWAPAASVFKIVTAAALLRAGVNPNSPVCYHGGFRSVEKSNLADHPQLDTTCHDLGFGLAKSQNALIAKLVHQNLTPKQLRNMAVRFGFGTSPNFALVAAPSQITLPSGELEFARVAAGFWKTEISPFSGAMIANLVATGGVRVTPRIVAAIRKRGRKIPVVAGPKTRILDRESARVLADMMSGTVRYGTAHKGFYDKRGQPILRNTTVAGKTGSLTRTSPTYLAYSWFVGFAPVEDPKIVISVLLGNEAKWHLKAHTAARLVLRTILK